MLTFGKVTRLETASLGGVWGVGQLPVTDDMKPALKKQQATIPYAFKASLIQTPANGNHNWQGQLIDLKMALPADRFELLPTAQVQPHGLLTFKTSASLASANLISPLPIHWDIEKEQEPKWELALKPEAQAIATHFKEHWQFEQEEFAKMNVMLKYEVQQVWEDPIVINAKAP